MMSVSAITRRSCEALAIVLPGLDFSLFHQRRVPIIANIFPSAFLFQHSRGEGLGSVVAPLLGSVLVVVDVQRLKRLAVVPDVVVKDAKVSAFRDLELSLERWALLRESESSAEQESECQRRSRDDFC